MPNSIHDLLSRHQFGELFLDELGWDAAQGCPTIAIDGQPFEFEAIAQKRGLLVLRCQTDRIVLANRGLLRLVQKKLSPTYHEHLLIYTSETPRKQVWQWSIRKPDGGRLRHREHPFFSSSPPNEFVARLEKLRFTLEEEEQTTILDALGRVRVSLDRDADLNLFAHKPSYAKRSDELAFAMQAGVPGARDAFLQMHLPLVQWTAKKFHRRFHIDLEDVEQICAIGMLRAAERFDPALGYQFSTYAFHSMRRNCQRLCEEARFVIRFPVHVVPTCKEAEHQLPRLLAAGEPANLHKLLEKLFPNDAWRQHTARTYLLAREMRSLSLRRSPEYQQASDIVDRIGSPSEHAIRAEHAAIVRSALTMLNARAREMVGRWYGLDGPPQTLETIGSEFRVTRERVRQIIKVSIGKLRRYLEKYHFFEGFSTDALATPADELDAVNGDQRQTG